MLSMANSTDGPAESGLRPHSPDFAFDRPPSFSDDVGDDDDFYGDQDGAQSFIQPAISPIATRLTSPRTPAAEKAAAMDRVRGGGLFGAVHETGGPSRKPTLSPPTSPVSPKKLSKPQETQSSPTLDSIPSGNRLVIADPAATWHAGSKELAAGEAKPPRSSMSGVFGGNVRHRRSHSVGENALRRLSKAFPSINLPTSFLPNLSTPSFFSSSSSHKEATALTQSPQAPPSRMQNSRPAIQPTGADGSLQAASQTAPPSQNVRIPGFHGSPSVTSRRSQALRRSTSEDSMLYHSLARVSSFGDDERFTHIREQVNVRFKAIRDSWDGPSFKLPQMPNILPTPKSGSLRASQRTNRDAISSLDAVLETLTGDIVVMGGYRGSILRSAQAPYRQLWVPVKVGLNIRKVNLEVGLDPEDEEKMEDQIFASGMLQHIGPVDISRRLFKKLRDCENVRRGKLRIHDYGYDWRLSPHLLSRKLVEFIEKLPANHPSTPPEQRGALVIAHSLGGLITRHAVNQRPEIFSGVVFAGTPQRCINVLGPIRNGDAVLLNEKVLTAQVNFSLRTTFALLPDDGFCFIDKYTQEEYPIDFHNVDDWIKYRLSPCVSDAPLPPAVTKSNTFGSLRSISESFSSLPLRSRTNSEPKKAPSPHRHPAPEAPRTAKSEMTKDRTLAPQMGSSSSGDPAASPPPSSPAARSRNIAYLARTLAETKRFRAELAHLAGHAAANAYPPLAVVYGKDTPTVWAARVAGREAIAGVAAYDDLVFRSGDGVVLAREAMLPEGYETAKGGRVSTDHGHITMLGDLEAVGRALEAVVRGRRRGIGLGERIGG